MGEEDRAVIKTSATDLAKLKAMGLPAPDETYRNAKGEKWHVFWNARGWTEQYNIDALADEIGR